MKLRWKITLGLLGALAVLLALNTFTTGNQTRGAEVTAEDGRILNLSRGDVQVVDSGDPGANGQPVVLIHCYACSLHWYERIEPLLSERHRVIRIDLLGFGGSEKPESGFEIDSQAAMVAEALNQLEVEGALVAGHSMGAMVAASLAEQASQLVDRVAVIGMAPNTSDFGSGLPFLAKLSYVPVLGQALWRLAPDFAVRDGYRDSFAPGFELEEGFADPDQVIADYEAMTYSSFDRAQSEADDFVSEQPLDERFTRTPVPLLVIFGAEDQIFDADRAVDGFAGVPGVQTEIIERAGHAPQVERPEEVAELIDAYSVDLEPTTPRGERRRGANRDRPQGRAGARDRQRRAGGARGETQANQRSNRDRREGRRNR